MNATDLRTSTGVAPWLLVAIGTPEEPEQPVNRRRLVLTVVAAALVVALVVILGGSLIARRMAEAEAVRSAASRGGVLALDVAEPALRDGVVTGDRAARARLDTRVREHVLAPDVARVKVWDSSGRIVYSDEPRLVGHRYGLAKDELEALESDGVEAEVSDLSSPDNRYERGGGPLLEVYRAVHTPNGTPLLFETYFRYGDVLRNAEGISLGFAGVTAASLLLLLLALVPLLRGLVRALDRGRERREQLLVRALDASDAERRRIAAAVHDGPVQDLVGASFQVGAASGSVADPDAARTLEAAELTMRGTIQNLRVALVDLYPPSLADAGLAESLGDLAAGARSRGVPVIVRVDSATELTEPAQRLVFRVAREALANAVKHGGGSIVRLTLGPEGGRIMLQVVDEGPGFDVAAMLAQPPDAHFGLRLLQDAVREGGVRAELTVRSAPGQGTAWRLALPD